MNKPLLSLILKFLAAEAFIQLSLLLGYLFDGGNYIVIP